MKIDVFCSNDYKFIYFEYIQLMFCPLNEFQEDNKGFLHEHKGPLFSFNCFPIQLPW